MSRTTARFTQLAAVLAAGVLTLTACGDDADAGHGSMNSNDTSASAATETGAQATHNDADITFAADMVPHHESAIEMAQLAPGRAADPRVLDLAARIEAAQGPEIDTLNGWLAEWGAAEGTGGMDHGSMDQGGMEDMDMTALMNASGAEFDRLFLQQMTEHHRGAVQMAETELAEGRNSDALVMAETIRDTQTGEIAEMEQLLTELGG